jgi:hypothetical protein
MGRGSPNRKFRASTTPETECVETLTGLARHSDVSRVAEILGQNNVIRIVFCLFEGREFVWMPVIPAFAKMDVRVLFHARVRTDGKSQGSEGPFHRRERAPFRKSSSVPWFDLTGKKEIAVSVLISASALTQSSLRSHRPKSAAAVTRGLSGAVEGAFPTRFRGGQDRVRRPCRRGGRGAVCAGSPPGTG